MSLVSGATSLRFSTGGLAPSHRVQALRELFDRSIQLNIDATGDAPIEMEMVLTPGLRRARMLSPFTARVTRPARMLVDGEDTICLMIKMAGEMSVAQGRREGVPQRGDGVLLVYREPAVVNFDEATYLSIRVPFGAVAPLARIGDAAGSCVSGEALSLLKAYVGSLPEQLADPQVGRLVANHVYDLISLAIGATKEGRDLAIQRGVRAARLAAARSELINNVQVDIVEVAKRQRVSVRYIQLLFEEAGTTFTAFALEQRLDAARRMLTSPRYAHQSITAIAMDAGFADLSYFNRTFKKQYLMTPREMRGLAIKEL